MEDRQLSFTLEDAIENVGFGRFQWFLMAACGAWWAADAMEVMVVSFLLPSLRHAWNLHGFWEGSIGSSVFVGFFFGTFFWGTISDRFGRRNGYLAVALASSIFGMASTFAPSLPWMLVLRGLTGFGIGGSPVAFSMFSEFLPTSSRGKWMILFEGFWVIGTLLEAGLAWLILPRLENGWRWLLGLSAAPFFFFLAIYPWIPESPRYLLLTGQNRRATDLLRKVARMNKKSLPEGELESITQSEDNEPIFKKVTNLFRPGFKRLTLVLWFLWFAHSLGYYGLVLFTPQYFDLLSSSAWTVPAAPPTHAPSEEPISDEPIQLSPSSIVNDSSVYMLVFVTTLGELPGLILSGFLVDKIGRRYVQTAFLTAAAFCLGGMMFNPSPWVAIFLLLGGRMFVNGSWAALWAYTPESYPTVIRATGLGAANGMSKFASIFTPYISTMLLEISPFIPIIIFGSFSLLGAIASVFLPFDTASRSMADQLDPAKVDDSPTLGLAVDDDEAQPQIRSPLVRQRRDGITNKYSDESAVDL